MFLIKLSDAGVRLYITQDSVTAPPVSRLKGCLVSPKMYFSALFSCKMRLCEMQPPCWKRPSEHEAPPDSQLVIPVNAVPKSTNFTDKTCISSIKT